MHCFAAVAAISGCADAEHGRLSFARPMVEPKDGIPIFEDNDIRFEAGQYRIDSQGGDPEWSMHCKDTCRHFVRLFVNQQDDAIVRWLMKDPYLFDFLTLEEPFHERELETGLLLHIQKFLLELVRGFPALAARLLLTRSGSLPAGVGQAT